MSDMSSSARSGKTRVAVLYGGRSSEHSISCVSAGAVLSAIDRTRFEPIPIGITRSGEWIISDEDPRTYSLDKLPVLKADASSKPVVIDLTRHGDGFLVGQPGTVGKPVAEQKLESLGHIDAVFPVLHGLGGEDGAIQGMLETLGVPYVGCGIFASSACMDKHFTKVVLQQAGIPVTPGITLDTRLLDHDSHFASNSAEIAQRLEKAGLSYPLFIKPGDGGSSIGVHRVENAEDLIPALWDAAQYDWEILVEKCVDAREVECAVLSLDNSQPPQTAWPGEVVKTKAHEFYDFEQKYQSSSSTRVQVPADLPHETLLKIRSLASRAFQAVGGRGLMRVDTFVQPDGSVQINEINTMPGFTAISMWPKAWEEAGLPYSKAITELIESSIAHQEDR
jgi:D-alanine-D-alanine ligase